MKDLGKNRFEVQIKSMLLNLDLYLSSFRDMIKTLQKRRKPQLEQTFYRFIFEIKFACFLISYFYQTHFFRNNLNCSHELNSLEFKEK